MITNHYTTQTTNKGPRDAPLGGRAIHAPPGLQHARLRRARHECAVPRLRQRGAPPRRRPAARPRALAPLATRPRSPAALRGNRLSNTPCLAQVFFNSGEQFWQNMILIMVILDAINSA